MWFMYDCKETSVHFLSTQIYRSYVVLGIDFLSYRLSNSSINCWSLLTIVHPFIGG